MEKYISILNSPAATDCVISGNTVSITGLKPFAASSILSFKAKKSLYATPVKVAASSIPTAVGGTVSFSITQTVNGILQTFYFSYVVDSAANLNTAIAAWSASSGVDVTVVGSGSLGSQTITATADTTNVSFEMGGQFITSAGVITPMNFEDQTITTVSTIATTAPAANNEIVFTKAAHGLFNGQIVYCDNFNNMAVGVNKKFYRVIWLTANTFSLSDMNGATALKGSAVAGTTGDVTTVAVSSYGSYEQVNAEAAATGSTQTATQTTSVYSCLEITGTYANTAMGNLVQPQSFTANVWYVDAAATGATARLAGTVAFEEAFQLLIS